MTTEQAQAETIAALRKQLSESYAARRRMCDLMIKFMHRARKAEKEVNECQQKR